VEQQTQPKPPSGTSGGSGLAPNVASLLCYVCTFITGIIFLLIEKDNKEVKFHAWQAIFLGVASIALQIAITILTLILGQIASALAMIVGLVGWLVYLGIFVVWIVAMVKAYKGEHWLIPVIGNLAEQQANK
jgi:uncharacterized membrane protein